MARRAELEAQIPQHVDPPSKVKPDEGVFLEFAPIKRRYDIPYEKQQDPKLAEGLHALV
ncbi:MAG: hypothetical protein ISR77_38185 [Pirellulaceae bacterium]|nr:hypothetical protein [Pirellulaceae bacterium]